MPTLDWIGKKAVENHHRQVPFHLLKDVADLSVGEAGSGNLLVEGDNLMALKALLPYYGGQVKCIYIDPPYNTGKEYWIYNDAVNNYSKFRLRAALEERIKNAKGEAMRKVHQSLLIQAELFAADERCSMVFEDGRYAYNYAYAGFTELPKHFFPVVGDLKESGEEFDCALFIATQLRGAKYWVRNIQNKETSFSLQTSTDRFYPDFVCQLEDGRVLVIEYKNERDSDLPDSIEKTQLGMLWENRSGGKGVFIMTRGENFEAIQRKVDGKKE